MRVSFPARLTALALFVPLAADAQMFSGFVEDMLQSQLGTVSVEANQIISDGELRSCELSYSALQQDFEYRDGAFMSLEGVIIFERSDETSPRLILKLALEYIDSETGYGTPFAPGHVFVVRGEENTRGTHLRSGRGEEQGTIVTEYDASETHDMVLASLREDSIALAFEREPFVPAAPFEIDPTVVETDYDGVRVHSPEARDTFLDCAEALLGRAEN